MLIRGNTEYRIFIESREDRFESELYRLIDRSSAIKIVRGGGGGGKKRKGEGGERKKENGKNEIVVERGKIGACFTIRSGIKQTKRHSMHARARSAVNGGHTRSSIRVASN